MPLDRTWYNSLVDDDGSNTVGTVWGKDDVDALMDAVDAEVPTRWASWNPEWRTVDASELCTVGQNSCRFYKVSNVLHLSLFSVNVFFGTSSSALMVTLPPGNAPATATIESFLLRVQSGSNPPEWGYALTKDAGWLEVRRAGNASWAGFTQWSIFGQGFYLL